MNGPKKTINLNEGEVPNLGYLLLPGFDAFTFQCATRPLRLKNNKSDSALPRKIVIYTADDAPVTSSDGLQALPTARLAEDVKLRSVVVIGGDELPRHYSPELVHKLRHWSDQDISIGGAYTGTHLLAYAGLLDGCRCTIHWDYVYRFKEQFPNIDVNNKIYVVDKDRYTSSGGLSSLDLMINMLGVYEGVESVRYISDYLNYSHFRDGSDEQKGAMQKLLASSQPKLSEAAAIMENNIEEPLSSEEIAQFLNISRRQLERLFKKHFSKTPTQHYIDLRMQRAKSLLVETSLSIESIARSCGFGSTSLFCKRFNTHFGMNPSRIRQNIGSDVAFLSA